MEPSHRFLRACLRLPVDRTPIWIMRQAGRYLPEYLKVRAEAGDFLSLCRSAERATEVTMQPIDRFGFDAAILFSDILVVPEAMGIDLRFAVGEGPILSPPVRTAADLERIREADLPKLEYVMNVIRSIRGALQDRVPLIGFSGSPWTLATYMVEGSGSKTFNHIKGMMFSDPDTLHRLLDLLARSVSAYLNAQIAAGAQAVQIFDTWGGVLSPVAFREFSLDYMRRVVAGLNRTGPDGMKVPVILFAKGCGSMIEEIADTGCDVVGVDWTLDMAEARERVGDRVALQGNLDPATLFAPPERIRQEVRTLLEAFGPHPGHIFNLGHGVTPDVDPDRVAVLVQAVQEESARLHGKGAL